MSLFIKIKAPLTEHIIGMGIRRSKKAFHVDAIIDGPGKVRKLLPMHFLADVFTQTAFQPCLLGRA